MSWTGRQPLRKNKYGSKALENNTVDSFPNPIMTQNDLFWLCTMWNLSSLTRVQICAPCSGSWVLIRDWTESPESPPFWVKEKYPPESKCLDISIITANYRTSQKVTMYKVWGKDGLEGSKIWGLERRDTEGMIWKPGNWRLSAINSMYI